MGTCSKSGEWIWAKCIHPRPLPNSTPCPSGHRDPLGWVANLVGHTAGPGAFLVASNSRLALLTCSFSGNGAAKPCHQLFYGKGLCRDAEWGHCGPTGGPLQRWRTAFGFRCWLGTYFSRVGRIQALRENMRKSALASQNKNMLTHNEAYKQPLWTQSFLFSYVFCRPVCPLPTPGLSRTVCLASPSLPKGAKERLMNPGTCSSSFVCLLFCCCLFLF